MAKQYELKIDPTGGFEGADDDRILEACGFIPIWVADWLQNHQDDLSLKDYLDQTYGFGLYPMGEKGWIDDDGTYHYPGDPDLPPYISIETPVGLLYQYSHGIVAIPHEGELFVTRMD